MRTHKPFTVSLSPELFAQAEELAKERGFKRSTYIQQLILADLRKARAEKTPKQKPTKSRPAKGN